MQRRGLSLEAEVERIIGTVRATERYGTIAVVTYGFRTLLKQVYTTARVAKQFAISPGFSPALITTAGDF